jgi:two-component sensor histidine kinase
MAREGRGCIEGVELVALMLSELATNAVQHARTEFVVDITLTREASRYRVRVGVTDQSPDLPVLPEPATDAPHGRGLRIVESLADAWGIEIRRGHPGKTVWFVAMLVAHAPAGEDVDPPTGKSLGGWSDGPRRRQASRTS